MQTPAQIDFQGLNASPQAYARVQQWLAKLGGRYGRITACRVGDQGAGRAGQYSRSKPLIPIKIHSEPVC